MGFHGWCSVRFGLPPGPWTPRRLALDHPWSRGYSRLLLGDLQVEERGAGSGAFECIGDGFSEAYRAGNASPTRTSTL
jgi:hypothetical protein